MRGIKKFIVDIFVEGFFRRWYRFVNNADKNAEVVFMNYGYAGEFQEMSLDQSDEINRYPIQLYYQLVSAHELENKDILEIGCGRGGGLAFLTKLLKPSSAVGIDRDPSAIKFCNRFWGKPGLTFLQGDAQTVALPDCSFDVIINVESSHRYEDMNLFLKEVRRLLRPNGLFLLTDFRGRDEMPELLKQFSGSGLQALGDENVTNQVVRALELDDSRRRKLIEELVPSFLHKIAYNFSGTKGSPTYRKFASGKWIYFNYFFKKVPAVHVVTNDMTDWKKRNS